MCQAERIDEAMHPLATMAVGLYGQTLPFNGYAEQVADLYRGMDLRKFY